MVTGPFPIEDFLASVTASLKIRGDARSIAVLLEGDCYFEHLESDFGVDSWSLRIGLPIHIFHALAEAEIKQIQDVVRDIGRTFFAAIPADHLQGVSISPAVIPAPEGWRQDAAKFVRGEGVTNQGRVRSDNIASRQHQGLLFRSKAEITLFEAMQRAQLAIAPLPVFVRVGKNYNRLEPDFLVIYKGLTFVVEVDGDTFHHETPADADKRLIPLTLEGVEVRRIRATDVETEHLADAAVRSLIDFMSKRKVAR